MRGACRQEELERQRAAKVESAEVRRPPAPDDISDTYSIIIFYNYIIILYNMYA